MTLKWRDVPPALQAYTIDQLDALKRGKYTSSFVAAVRDAMDAAIDELKRAAKPQRKHVVKG